ncbi:TetR/AcrR family transcriptional regulator [Lacinutrix sp. C3R15]|uniref:TetR family transcriptional regulator C-terminal domain-containing protein n=1 Tax=Flavobacteriaceae TaxID=49546 RepID=UPI001C09007A|nr:MULTISPECIES: TetR family transcriptional regulator C-terminal domain-containing protein [Flavobacteriaceae]MBU2938802.1 TetR/AcrR family transcriptional regulator [Lacinutrix sp. C3R15]MDO6622115.1 TetR family transcriptional regulator C-terminal domain-containing protein [Oceanihabitans sp. 1_MG-2023]
MTRKKAITDTDIISFYMDYILENNKKPNTVYQFAKAHDITEETFYKHFASFKVLEASIFSAFYKNTLNALAKSEDYKSFDARNKLISFYYTFFENLTANRSYVLFVLHENKNSFKGLQMLSQLKYHFLEYIASLEIETIDVPQKQIQQIQNKALKESAWMQLLLTIKFWMEDTSASFEKTDVLIEKSVNTSFDILNITPLKSVMDLGKFLFKEKANMSS